MCGRLLTQRVTKNAMCSNSPLRRWTVTPILTKLLAGTNKNDYELRSYILFKNALEEAIKLNSESTKEEVNDAYNNLKEAYENLTRKDSE